MKSYVIGFTLSVVLTLAAVFIVLRPGFFGLGNNGVILTILVLAVAQLLVQLIFFLHLTDEQGPRWKLIIFLSTIFIVLLVVVGSIWIMNHLNYNMMASPSDMNKYINSQDAL